jgi:hypothetical protein
MSEHTRTSQSWFVRLCEIGKACLFAAHAAGRHLARLFPSRSAVPAEELDDGLKRDIGFDGRTWPDRRTAHYRTLLKRGQPLP